MDGPGRSLFSSFFGGTSSAAPAASSPQPIPGASNPQPALQSSSLPSYSTGRYIEPTDFKELFENERLDNSRICFQLDQMRRRLNLILDEQAKADQDIEHFLSELREKLKSWNHEFGIEMSLDQELRSSTIIASLESKNIHHDLLGLFEQIGRVFKQKMEEIAALNRRCEALSQALLDKEEAGKGNSNAASLLASLRDQLEEASRKQQEWEPQRTALEAAQSELKERLQALQKKYEGAQREMEALQEANAALSADLEKALKRTPESKKIQDVTEESELIQSLHEQIEGLEKVLHQARQESQAAKAEAKRLTLENNQLQDTIGEQQVIQERSLKQMQELRMQFGEHMQGQEFVQARLASSIREVAERERENAFMLEFIRGLGPELFEKFNQALREKKSG
jgi:chromosome segregation ATPase